MTERFIVAFTPQASREVGEAKRWWRANRTKAPDALDPGVRRIFLNRVNYFLYYRPKLELRVVEVVALWHARRGTGPRL